MGLRIRVSPILRNGPKNNILIESEGINVTGRCRVDFLVNLWFKSCLYLPWEYSQRVTVYVYVKMASGTKFLSVTAHFLHFSALQRVPLKRFINCIIIVSRKWTPCLVFSAAIFGIKSSLEIDTVGY